MEKKSSAYRDYAEKFPEPNYAWSTDRAEIIRLLNSGKRASTYCTEAPTTSGVRDTLYELPDGRYMLTYLEFGMTSHAVIWPSLAAMRESRSPMPFNVYHEF